MKAYIVLAPGFEEVEAVAVIDVLRRGGMDVKTVSIAGNHRVTGAHQVELIADQLFEATDFSDATLLVLPGGMPGITNLMQHEALAEVLLEYHKKNKWIAAICAAPMVLGKLGILKDRMATCYPGCEASLLGAKLSLEAVVVDGHVVTSRGVGTALAFALKLVDLTLGEKMAEKLREGMLICC